MKKQLFNVGYVFFVLFCTNVYAQQKFVHPGVIISKVVIKSLQTIAKNKKHAYYPAFSLLKENVLVTAAYQMRGPFEYIARDGEFKYTKQKMEADFDAAYLNALMFAATKDADYAKTTLEVLDAYANTLVGIPTSNDAPLLAGLEGFKIVAAMELMKHLYPKAKKSQIEKIDSMIRNIFLPICDQFYDTKPYTNGNWGAIITKMYMASAIYFEDRDMYNKAVDFALHGYDNGNLKYYVDSITGQVQESGRDQGHTQLGLGALATVCELAYIQGTDLYSANNNALLKGYEYTAKYNLGNDSVPFFKWTDVSGKYCRWTKISEIGRGRFQPVYDVVYHHYVQRKGLQMPYSKQVIEKIRPSKYDGGHPGLESIIYIMDPL